MKVFLEFWLLINKRMKAEFNTRKSAMVILDDIYHNESTDYVEVCKWHNGEGWDISISDKTTFSLHYTEFKAIKKLIKMLDNEENFKLDV